MAQSLSNEDYKAGKKKVAQTELDTSYKPSAKAFHTVTIAKAE